jgi:RNase adaptor protein for sRNA GlmZ degradation
MTSSSKTEKKGLLHNDYGKLKKQKTRKMFFSSADQFSRMERYEELDKNHPLNRKFQGDAQFRGPICNMSQMISSHREKKTH